MEELMDSLGWQLGLKQGERETKEAYFARIRQYVQEHPEQYHMAVDRVVKRKPCVVKIRNEKEKDTIKKNTMKTIMSVAYGMLR